jgi:(S)-ureidoglycine aminohydrolase
LQHLGHSRSAQGGNHLLQTPDTFVRAPLPGMRDATAIVHVSPAGGAAFTQFTAEFAYLPPASPHPVSAAERSRAAVIDKPYERLAGREVPAALFGRERDVAATALLDDPWLEVRGLVPDDPAFDFRVNTMTYRPGASLPAVEMHVMEHGLLMLDGGGIYRLGDSWYPVQAGDFIWMGPYCPQWFGAIGKTPAKYLIYKDWDRQP